MILTLIYFSILTFLIYRNGFFGIFKDAAISKKYFALAFVIKCLAIPVFYFIYEIKYGGISKFDAGIYLEDAKQIQAIAFDSPLNYLKVLLGWHDESKLTELYQQHIANTTNWDEGLSYRLFFNDNRSVIRLHSLFCFLSFGNYFVHALFSCFLSFIGIALIYRSLKSYFEGKELWLLLCFIVLPNLWLFTGALLKEPLVVFNLGLIFLCIDKIYSTGYSVVKKIGYGVLLLFVCYYLKPQVSVPVAIFFALFRMSERFGGNRKILLYASSLLLLFVLSIFSFRYIKGRGITDFLNIKQREFVEVMNGGYFLKDEVKFVHLPHDSLLLMKIKEGDSLRYSIKAGSTFHYWLDRDQSIKHFCANNADTSTKYTLIYELIPARSGFMIDSLTTGIKGIFPIMKSVAYGLFLPLKFSSVLDVAVTLEHLLLAFCLVVSLAGVRYKKQKLPVLFFISMVLFFAFLFGFATPNTGAIVRYRSVVMPFLLASAVYILKLKNDTKAVRGKD